MAWKGESRRHSLARKGVKTSKGEVKSKANEKMKQKHDRAVEDAFEGGWVIDDWHSGSDALGEYFILYMEGKSGKKYSLDVKVRHIYDEDNGYEVADAQYDKAWKDIIESHLRIDDYSTGSDYLGDYLILKMQGISGKEYALDVLVRSIEDEGR